MKYEMVIGHIPDAVIFKIQDGVYAIVGEDVQYKNNWISLTRFVEVKKGKPSQERFEKAVEVLNRDDGNWGELPKLDAKIKEFQDELEDEIEDSDE